MELDVEYREVAEQAGVPGYYRCPGAEQRIPAFIESLADLVRQDARARSRACAAWAGGRTCPEGPFGDCPHARAGTAKPLPKRYDARLVTPSLLRLVIFDCDGVLVDSEGPSNRLVTARRGVGCSAGR